MMFEFGSMKEAGEARLTVPCLLLGARVATAAARRRATALQTEGGGNAAGNE